ncbi:MAG: heavy-metal-associated domain-containing protein [Phycisphaerales bacterium]
MNTTLTITGMHCPACAKRLTEAFGRVAGVASAHVTLHPPEAHIESDGPVPMAALHDAARRAGNYSVALAGPGMSAAGEAQEAHTPVEKKPSLYPLILIVLYIAGTAALTTWLRGTSGWSWHTLMLDFMAGFFLVFSFFKLLDLRGFADAYQSYDVLARRSRAYALAYPFLELALGVAYLIRWQPTITNSVTLGLMLLGSVGVLRAVLSKRTIRCACLGTALNLPMTTVTLVEDLGMAAMVLAALVWPH